MFALHFVQAENNWSMKQRFKKWIIDKMSFSFLKKLIRTILSNEKRQMKWLMADCSSVEKRSRRKDSGFCECGSVERNECAQCFPVYRHQPTLSPCERIANWTSLISASLAKKVGFFSPENERPFHYSAHDAVTKGVMKLSASNQ